MGQRGVRVGDGEVMGVSVQMLDWDARGGDGMQLRIGLTGKRAQATSSGFGDIGELCTCANLAVVIGTKGRRH